MARRVRENVAHSGSNKLTTKQTATNASRLIVNGRRPTRRGREPQGEQIVKQTAEPSSTRYHWQAIRSGRSGWQDAERDGRAATARNRFEDRTCRTKIDIRQ